MATPNPTPTSSATSQVALEEAAERAGRDWKRIWLRIRTISPRSFMRTALVLTSLGLIVWLIDRAGADLMPFWIGIVIAYITAPLVRWLDSLLPRSVAVLLVLLLELAIILAFFVILLPSLVTELSNLLRALPERGVLRARVDQALASLKIVAPNLQVFLRGWLDNAYANLQTNFGVLLRQALQWGVGTALGLLSSFTFILGFLVIPQWLVAVLSSQESGSRWLDKVLADWLRPDFWATVKIIDRTFAVYVRARAIIALTVGLITAVAFSLFPYFGLPPMPYIGAVVLITMFLNLIPVVGPVLAAVPPLVLAMSVSWEQVVIVLGVIIGAQVLKTLLVTPRVEDRAVDIHPAILAFIIVLASQFGWVWAVLAGPLAVAIRDLFRYVYGRLLVPSRPAGVLPGTPEMAALAKPQRQVATRQISQAAGD